MIIDIESKTRKRKPGSGESNIKGKGLTGTESR